MKCALPLTMVGCVLLAGCHKSDPVWDIPCDERPAREVLIGTGESEFIPLGKDKLQIQYGSQGGQHIWMSLRLRGFGPEITAQFGFFDTENPALVYSGPNTDADELQYNDTLDVSETLGMFAVLNDWDEATQMPMPSPSGHDVILWADVTDQCTTEAVHADAPASVE
ncbi:MAG: hypothetical protein IPK82_01900 [Polyangiaceae bacterium]|nr:hypothetical protein [Polyangiaceae bacterium]